MRARCSSRRAPASSRCACRAWPARATPRGRDSKALRSPDAEVFKEVLIANRGEIALRVIRACRELGVQTVAVSSEADRESLHVRFADDDVCIGPAPARDSYLKIPRLIAAAEITGADAIHPGYGFLAENAEFAEIVTASNIAFIGPTVQQIRVMGDKAAARKAMTAVGVPIIPGTPGPVEDVEEALDFAQKIGFPVIIKAAAGGGGKGMRVAKDADEFERSFSLARSEALSAFGSGDVYVEKYLRRPRHIEFQIMGDKFGNVIHLGERDCSVQRRHQKLIEESPSPAMTPDLRKRMGDAAVAGAKAIDYVGAGTIPMLLHEDRSFFFLEVDTRIHVDHSVSRARHAEPALPERRRGHEVPRAGAGAHAGARLMRIDVVFGLQQLTPQDTQGRVVAVIDVLRASTTIAVALTNGARAIIPTESPDDAVTRSKHLERGAYRLAGERRMLKMEGFDLGNSPLEHTREAVEGKTVILTTTNGTRALLAVQGARDVVVASYVNLTAVSAMLRSALRGGADISLVCAGQDRQFALEDAACAGRDVHLGSRPLATLERNDAARAATLIDRKYGDNLMRLFNTAADGRG